MKFDPIDKELYTDDGRLIKKLHCPFKISWDNLEPAAPNYRKCSMCDNSIVDTKYLTDEQLLSMMEQKPETCLKVDLNQENLKIFSNGNFRENK